MVKEIVITSVPKGLFPYESGFCVVAATQGLDSQTKKTLELNSGYRRVQGAYKPTVYSHCVYETPRGALRVLARIQDAALDYTGRTNKLAWSVVVSEQEARKAEAGPAELLKDSRLFENDDWEPGDKPTYLNERELPRAGSSDPTVAAQRLQNGEWARLANDPGWAGLLASTVYTDKRVVFLIEPEQDKLLLNLYREAISLLPPSDRWLATFSTFFTEDSLGTRCRWKGLIEERNVAKYVANPQTLAIDLRSGTLGRVENVVDPNALDDKARKYVEFARGESAPTPSTSSTSSSMNEDALTYGVVDTEDTAIFYSSIKEETSGKSKASVGASWYRYSKSNNSLGSSDSPDIYGLASDGELTNVLEDKRTPGLDLSCLVTRLPSIPSRPSFRKKKRKSSFGISSALSRSY